MMKIREKQEDWRENSDENDKNRRKVENMIGNY